MGGVYLLERHPSLAQASPFGPPDKPAHKGDARRAGGLTKDRGLTNDEGAIDEWGTEQKTTTQRYVVPSGLRGKGLPGLRRDPSLRWGISPLWGWVEDSTSFPALLR
jgi:hypothetical protein